MIHLLLWSGPLRPKPQTPRHVNDDGHDDHDHDDDGCNYDDDGGGGVDDDDGDDGDDALIHR